MSKLLKGSLKVLPIPLFQDNYSYFICSKTSTQGILIDPADEVAIPRFMRENLPNHKVEAILYTHKHWDHIGNPKQLIENLTKSNQTINLRVAASLIDSAFIEGVNHFIQNEREEFQINQIVVQAFQVPCHTKGHCIYLLEGLDQECQQEEIGFYHEKCLFTGDTLFIGGCGKFFEGNAEQMEKNMKLISSFQDNSLVFCAHEYTISNLLWGLSLDPDNKTMQLALSVAQEKREKGQPTVPSSIAQEKLINLFLRSDDPMLQKAMQAINSIDLVDKLRENKNQFKI